MSRYWSPLVKTLSPYVPGEQPQHERLIKLNTNESPYGPSPRALAAMREASCDDLRLYPDPESRELRQAFAQVCGVSPQQVFVGNGSDEVLAHAFAAFFGGDKPILFPDISYSFYPVYCALYGIAYRGVALRDDFAIDVAGFCTDNGGVIFPNPNAPTGMAATLEQVRRIVQGNPDVVVIVDEAYIDFGAESAVALIAEHDNLLVVQTLSKSRSLAGLRVGAAMGSEELIEGLTRIKNSFNSYPIDRLSQAGAVAALRDADYFVECRDKVVATRQWLTQALQGLGFEVLPSAANFVFTRHPQRAARELFASLRERGIIVRHFDKPRIDDFLRISVGSEEHCRALIDALGELLA